MTLGLLMLHAFPLDSAMWNPQSEGLAVTLPVVTVDLPGFGGTPMVEPEGWMDEAADFADAALGGTGIDRVVVCGLSMGGYVALAYARRHRDKLAGLILANTRADGDDEAARERRKGLADRLRSEGNFLADSPPPLLSDGASAELREQVSTIIRRQEPESIARASLAMAGRADSRGDLAGIDVPTLVITSSADALISPDLSKEMAEAIPNAELKTIDGVGHLSNLEAPDAFNDLVRDFVSRIER